MNFHVPQTSKFDSYSPEMKRLTTRLDSKRYIQRLEDKLRGYGEDPEAMQSNYMYNPLNMEFQEHKFPELIGLGIDAKAARRKLESAARKLRLKKKRAAKAAKAAAAEESWFG